MQDPGSTAATRLRGLGLPIVLLTLLGCAKPAVTVEQVHEQQDVPRRSSGRVFPPTCDEIPTADYPEMHSDKRPETVSVRVDLTISRIGEPENLEATLLEAVEPAEPFLEAALIAAGKIRCREARRTPRPGTGEIALVPIEYRSSVIFRFYRDARKVVAALEDAEVTAEPR